MKLLLSLIALLASLGATQERRYEVGQVWAYETRPEEAGSLIRIQRIEKRGDIEVFHISIVGLHIEGLAGQSLPHSPVSRETLDRSVTRLSTATVAFPDPADGIEQWRRDNGGVFTIPVREIVGFVEQLLARARAGAPQN